MKAIVLHEYGGPAKLQYEDVPDPQPAENEVLVRIAATSVNPIDYKMRSGEASSRFPVQFPGILGRDLSGLVLAVGPGVSGFAPGDRVMGFAASTYAQLAAVPAANLIHLPENLDLVEAAALPLVLLTGEQLITRGAKVQRGQTVLVTGALGSVGRVAVFVARQAGATVLAGVRGSQLQAVAELGAEQGIALDDDNAIAALGQLDAVADTVDHETAEKLPAKVRENGVFASVLGPPANARLYPAVAIAPVQVQPDADALARLAGDVAAGRLKIPVDRMLPLEEAAEAHRVAEKGGVGKILLLPWKD